MSELQLGQKHYNPDVLSCLANLSNDEVFTPPQLANRVLDQLPPEIWHDSAATFLDPVTKTGVFLREITKRLLTGLEDEFPDLQQRLNHILHHQLFGIAITELTALLSRRSLYCSATANGKFSVDTDFDSRDGNIKFKPGEHFWVNDRCQYCGANKSQYERSSTLESYSYEFIHTYHPERIFKDMQFDVIVGNPPYQLSDGGFGKSAAPIYQNFVEQAIKLNPRYLSMIIPSRWFGGGKGLNDFRTEMLNDRRIRKIHDYENANECFPGVDIAGGVCYFLWDRDNPGQCKVTNIVNGEEYSTTRDLAEFEILVRDGKAIPIIRKVLTSNTPTMDQQVSSRKPFGLATNVRPRKQGNLILHWQKGEGPFPRSEVMSGREMIDSYKVICAKTSYDHAGSPDKNGMRKVFSKIEILPPGTICTETYLVAGYYETEEEAQNLKRYMCTHLFRFLISQFMFSQDITKDRFKFVPIQDSSHPWDDEQLYKKYGITAEEQKYIESRIREMPITEEEQN
jgi:site-specific DNA-methyltransferase (adenine-specific)